MNDSDKQDLISVAGAIDQQLSLLVDNIDILSSVTPLNYQSERQRFFENRFSVEPEFVYQEHTLDVHQTKRHLYALPIERISHHGLRQLYSDVIQSYVDKLDQLRSIGTPDFLYNSLRYYGEPDIKDISNANFLLHLPAEVGETPNYDALSIAEFMQTFCVEHGYEGTIEINNTMIANALVAGTKVKINATARMNRNDMAALAHHELGVHLLTTLNSQTQPLKILSLGCPLNTKTQEGIAILCEFLSGHFNINRLRTLALRVVAVESMIRERDFRTTFLLLKEQHNVDDNVAFTITSRVYRGGGYTKDYLYLRGFSEILNAYEQFGEDFTLLLAGKTEIRYFEIIKKLIEEDILCSPKYISPAVASPAQTNPIYKYIASALK